MTENKDDLISREALKKAIMFKDNANAETWEQLYDSVLEEIDNAPTVEQKYYERVIAQINPVIEARPQGEWEHWGSPFSDEQVANSIVCSVCGARFVEIQDEVFNFCPNCGADMRGDEK